MLHTYVCTVSVKRSITCKKSPQTESPNKTQQMYAACVVTASEEICTGNLVPGCCRPLYIVMYAYVNVSLHADQACRVEIWWGPQLTGSFALINWEQEQCGHQKHWLKRSMMIWLSVASLIDCWYKRQCVEAGSTRSSWFQCVTVNVRSSRSALSKYGSADDTALLIDRMSWELSNEIQEEFNTLVRTVSSVK